MKPLHVWPGQLWEEKLTYGSRRFRVTHVQLNAQTLDEDQPLTGTVSCLPILALQPPGSNGMDAFEAPLTDFPPVGNRFGLISVDPAFPGGSQQFETPIGAFSSEGEYFLFRANDGTAWRTGPNGKGLFQQPADDQHWDEVLTGRTTFANLREFGTYMHRVVFVGLS